MWCAPGFGVANTSTVDIEELVAAVRGCPPKAAILCVEHGADIAASRLAKCGIDTVVWFGGELSMATEHRDDLVRMLVVPVLAAMGNGADIAECGLFGEWLRSLRARWRTENDTNGHSPPPPVRTTTAALLKKWVVRGTHEELFGVFADAHEPPKLDIARQTGSEWPTNKMPPLRATNILDETSLAPALTSVQSALRADDLAALQAIPAKVNNLVQKDEPSILALSTQTMMRTRTAYPLWRWT